MANVVKDHSNFFPRIGDLVAETDTKDVAEKEYTVLVDDKGDGVVQQIESLCMNCRHQGVTRLMLTSIPYFREVIVMSFHCEHCGTANNEIQSAGQIQPEGTLYTTQILERPDLNRQIVRSSTCEITIPELDLSLPATKCGQLTTVEGLIQNVISDLGMDQPLRRVQNELSYRIIEVLLDKLRAILGHEEENESDEYDSDVKAADKTTPMEAFTIQLDDPAGNSWIEFHDSMSDPKWSMRTYRRTLEQNVALGLVASQNEPSITTDVDEEPPPVDGEVADDEVFVFHGLCSSCGHLSDTKMKKVTIPYFKDILIMSTNCDRCGYRDNEVKSGSATSEQGKRITLKVKDREDLSRDILKSETAGLKIPEIELDLAHGTLGGRFTTLEGILQQIHDELTAKAFVGDSTTAQDRQSFEKFLGNLKELTNVERPFTIILEDPLANSYMQNLYAPDPDPNMTIEMYERTWGQNEELGINDMKVENYTTKSDDRSNGETKAEDEEPIGDVTCNGDGVSVISTTALAT